VTEPSRPEEVGATPAGEDAWRFRVWAPSARAVDLHLLAPEERTMRLEPGAGGYHQAVVRDAPPGTRYRYVLDGGTERADPASRFQPEGVHGPSAVTGAAFAWTDAAWTVPRLADVVLYEIHVGTFTPAGTFDGVIGRLDDLAELGVTAIELMPVAEFPGLRNWGYDGVFPYAAHHGYGGPDGLRRLVDAAHARGLAVCLDVVYNHIGPEGNHLREFGPYFTEAYRTPWGAALNFDGEGSDAVRAFFTGNALAWVRDFHVDALRLDAIHGIFDSSPRPFLAELTDAVQALAAELGRTVHVIAESDANDAATVKPTAGAGLGFDAVWSDDFHHSVHALLTGERDGYYVDFGSLEDLETAFTEAFVYSGRPSAFRGRPHGTSARGISGERFVVCVQNHDQVGNRMRGERLSALVSLEAQKLAAGLLLLSPYVPLLFMGEEYGETAPFEYFVDHSEPKLIEAVRRGRAEEFAGMGWGGEPPDPQSPETFERSRPDPELAGRSPHRELRALHRELLEARRSIPALGTGPPGAIEAGRDGMVLVLRRPDPGGDALCVFNLGEEATVKLPEGAWRVRLSSSAAGRAGPGGGPDEDEEVAGAVTVPGSSFLLCLREGAG
jgi:maltooligosyltrehalose trehalohydrolase